MMKIRKSCVSFGLGVALLVASATPASAMSVGTQTGGWLVTAQKTFSELTATAGKTAAVGIGIAATVAILGGIGWGVYRLTKKTSPSAAVQAIIRGNQVPMPVGLGGTNTRPTDIENVAQITADTRDAVTRLEPLVAPVAQMLATLNGAPAVYQGGVPVERLNAAAPVAPGVPMTIEQEAEARAVRFAELPLLHEDEVNGLIQLPDGFDRFTDRQLSDFEGRLQRANALLLVRQGRLAGELDYQREKKAANSYSRNCFKKYFGSDLSSKNIEFLERAINECQGKRAHINEDLIAYVRSKYSYNNNQQQVAAPVRREHIILSASRRVLSIALGENGPKTSEQIDQIIEQQQRRNLTAPVTIPAAAGPQPLVDAPRRDMPAVDASVAVQPAAVAPQVQQSASIWKRIFRCGRKAQEQQ